MSHPDYTRLIIEMSDQIKELRQQLTEALTLLARYRDETPLGNQPHMISSKVDEVLGRK